MFSLSGAQISSPQHVRFIAKKELIMTNKSIPAPKRISLGSARTNTKAAVAGDRAESNHIMQYSG